MADMEGTAIPRMAMAADMVEATEATGKSKIEENESKSSVSLIDVNGISDYFLKKVDRSGSFAYPSSVLDSRS